MMKLSVLIMALFLTISCHQKPEKTASSKQSTNDSFEKFLYNFEPDASFSQWVDQCQTPLVFNDDLFEKEEIDELLSVLFSKIPSTQIKYISTKKLIQLVPQTQKVKNPSTSFDFYGFKQVEYDDFILVSLFAKKRERNEEFFGHAFQLSTYTKSGKHIDDCIWWIIDLDTLQLWTDIEVENNQFLSGEKKQITDDNLSIIHKSISLHQTGKFLISDGK